MTKTSPVGPPPRVSMDHFLGGARDYLDTFPCPNSIQSELKLDRFSLSKRATCHGPRWTFTMLQLRVAGHFVSVKHVVGHTNWIALHSVSWSSNLVRKLFFCVVVNQKSIVDLPLFTILFTIFTYLLIYHYLPFVIIYSPKSIC